MIDRVARPLTGMQPGCPPITYAPKRRGRPIPRGGALEATSILVFVHVHQRPRIPVRSDKKRDPGHVRSGGSRRVSTRQDARRH